MEEKLEIIAKWYDYEYIPKEKSYESYGWWIKNTFNNNAFKNPNFICITTFQLKFNSDMNLIWKCLEKIQKELNLLNYFELFNFIQAFNFNSNNLSIISSQNDLFEFIYNYITIKTY